MRRLAGLIILVCGLASASAHALVATVDKPVAVLRVLDKITARVEEIRIPVDKPYAFGTISIAVRACRTAPPEDTPESAAYIAVNETGTDAGDAPVFQGWMFASSPALSAMEHPVYDLWLTGCKDAQAESPSAAPASPASAVPAAR